MALPLKVVSSATGSCELLYELLYDLSDELLEPELIVKSETILFLLRKVTASFAAIL